jgi:hypothetical protein
MTIPRLILPLPPTDNNCRIPIINRGKPELIKSKEYRDWGQKAELAWLQYIKQLQADGFVFDLNNLDEPSDKIRCEYNYYLFKKSNNADDQTYEKATKDFLSGKLYTDDRYVKLNLVHSQVEVDKNNPRIEIDIKPKLHYKQSKGVKKVKIEEV